MLNNMGKISTKNAILVFCTIIMVVGVGYLALNSGSTIAQTGEQGFTTETTMTFSVPDFVSGKLRKMKISNPKDKTKVDRIFHGERM